jgi:hypothetical protein
MVRRGIVVAAASLAFSASSAASPHATLSLTGTHPVSVSGRHFRPHERVRVTLTPDRRVRPVTASAAGTFTVSLGTPPSGPCGGFDVVAVGNRGSRAALPMMHPDCIVRRG